MFKQVHVGWLLLYFFFFFCFFNLLAFIELRTAVLSKALRHYFSK